MATSRRGAGVEGHWNRRHIRTLAAFCAALGVILYASTIGFDFAFDDYSTLRDNRFVHEGVRGIPKLLNSSVLSGYRTAGDELYRPLSLVMFAFEWEAFPDNPAVGHAVNVALYGLTGFLICVLLDRLLRSTGQPVVATESHGTRSHRSGRQHQRTGRNPGPAAGLATLPCSSISIAAGGGRLSRFHARSRAGQGLRSR